MLKRESLSSCESGLFNRGAYVSRKSSQHLPLVCLLLGDCRVTPTHSMLHVLWEVQDVDQYAGVETFALSAWC